MDHSVNILNELQAISPEVARINRQLPYQVPAGYFDGLATQVMERIRAEEAALPPVLQGVTANPFTVPAGYFDNLADSILQRVKASGDTLTAQEELAVLSPLLSKLDKKLPFEAPAGYFSDLTENVVSGAKAIDFVNEELENLPAVLAGLNDKQVYEVPAGYFEQLPGQVLTQVRQAATPARVVSLSVGRKVMRYAVAAVIAGVMAMTAWWFTGKPGTDPVAPVAGTEKLPVKELNSIPEAELESYLDNQLVALPAELLAANSKPEIEADDMQDLLQNVSDAEIQKYLEQNMLTRHVATN
jgi:hypothetical protein